MEDCWHILGLEASTATERDVKAAYGRLLKVHRPGVDADGFQRVRGAYLAALADLRTGHVETSSVQEFAEPVNDNPLAPREIPEKSRNALEALRKSLDQEDESESLLRVQAACFSDRVGEDERQKEVFDIFRDHKERLARAITEAFVIGDLQHGWTHLARWVISQWHCSQDSERLSVLATALIQRRDLALDGDIVTVLVDCCSLLAFWNPSLASRLMDKAYPATDTTERDRITHKIEPTVALGRMFDRLPDEDLKFWWNVLHGDDFEAEWRSKAAAQRVSRLIRIRGLRWGGHVQLMRMMRSEDAIAYAGHFKSLRRKFEAIVDIGLASVGLHKYSRFYGTESRLELIVAATLLLLVVVAALALFLVSIFDMATNPVTDDALRLRNRGSNLQLHDR